jgi:hypothetical protein
VVAVAGDHGSLNINRPVWIVIAGLLLACYSLWERFEKIWKPNADERDFLGDGLQFDQHCLKITRV